MKKIQKFYGGGGIALGLDLAPYSYAAPAASTTASTTASTAAGSTVLPTLATVGKIAWPLALVGGATYGGLYLLGHAKNGAVSGAIEAAAEKERRRHLAEAEAKWREKNQYYADLINTYGSIQYPVGTFYDYDPSTGTAHLERNLGNDLVGRWTQNMRTHEQGNPYIYDITTGAIYNGEMTGPHSAYVSVPRSSTPITLSTGQTVALPADITDYRVFDESEDASGGTIVIDDSEDVGAATGSGAGTVAGAGAAAGAGAGNLGNPRRNDDDDDNQISSVEEYIRRFGKNINRRTARRLRKSERVSHDANGNINHSATRLLNRGAGGAGGAGGFPWQTFLWGTTLGGAIPFIYQAIFGDKEETNPELHGGVEYDQRAKGAIDQVVEGDTTVSTKRDSLKTEKTDWDQYFFPQ